MDITKNTNTADNAEINAEGAEIAVERPDNNGGITLSPANKNANTDDSGVYTHEFKKPFEYQGQKYKTVNFNFDSLSGDDMISAENEMMNNNEYALDVLLSSSYLSKLASKASGIPSDVIRAMPIRDFRKITAATRNFLADLES